MERQEAIEVIKKNWPDSSRTMLREALETLIPELKESDDEKTRRDLINFVRLYGDSHYSQIDKESAISWLEKQGKSHVNKLQVSDELYEHIRDTCACIDDALSSEKLADINDYLSMAERSAQSAFDMIEKQCEQKPVTINNLRCDELTWEDINTLEGIINNVHYEFRNGIGVESFGKAVLERFREIKGDEYMDSCEQKPTWSEEDNGFVDLLLAIFTNAHPNELFTTGDIAVFNGNSVSSNRIITWLKSLKPQNHWKPTEEQLQILHAQLIEGAVTYPEDKRVLTTLYEDLLKL